MDPMMKMKMKEKLIEELMGELDDNEAMKLKPKAMEVEVMGMKGKPDMDMEEGNHMSDEGANSMGGDEDDMDDEDLKQLMMSYMKK